MNKRIDEFLESVLITENTTIVGVKNYNKYIIEEYINFLNTYFNIQPQNLKIKVNKRINKRTFGYINLSKLRNGKNEIVIESKGTNYMLSMITHEYTHIVQYLKNNLDGKDDNIYWKGKEYISVEDYNNLDYNAYSKLPWEKEALENQKKIPDLFINGNHLDKLLGKDDSLDYIINNNLL